MQGDIRVRSCLLHREADVSAGETKTKVFFRRKKQEKKRVLNRQFSKSPSRVEAKFDSLVKENSGNERSVYKKAATFGDNDNQQKFGFVEEDGAFRGSFGGQKAVEMWTLSGLRR